MTVIIRILLIKQFQKTSPLDRERHLAMSVVLRAPHWVLRGLARESRRNSRKTTWLPRHRKMRPLAATAKSLKVLPMHVHYPGGAGGLPASMFSCQRAKIRATGHRLADFFFKVHAIISTRGPPGPCLAKGCPTKRRDSTGAYP